MTAKLAQHRFAQPVMGTVATVQLCEPTTATEAGLLAGRVFSWLHEVDRRFSTYRPDSEISRLDRGQLAISECSVELRHVLDRCADLWRETDGYFDVCAGGRLDPSGYVKGWSVQVASELLTAAGAANHLVDAGGDIQTRGRPTPDAEWQVGVRHPWDRSAVCWVLTGTDLAIATSGNYERGPHVIDPHTGAPVRGLCSVTVVGRDLGLADAYATAGFAMGQRGLRWLATLANHEIGVVTESGECFRSPGPPVRSTGRPATAAPS